jgi:hypothetical protein
LEPFLFWLTIAVAVGALGLAVSRGDFEKPSSDKTYNKTLLVMNACFALFFAVFYLWEAIHFGHADIVKISLVIVLGCLGAHRLLAPFPAEIGDPIRQGKATLAWRMKQSPKA